METGKRYIVTKGSDDGTFEVGDHIWPDEDGSILCKEAQGWIEREDVEGATKGMEVSVDQEWIEKRKKKLNEELAKLS